MHTSDLLFSSKYAEVRIIEEYNTLICSSLTPFIPQKDFKLIFEEIGELIKSHAISKLIFDKSSLKIFDQPSMIWYHLEWKVKMYELGLRKHRKILPEDSFFVQSVKTAREKILRDHPEFDIEKYNIKYAKTLEDAILD